MSATAPIVVQKFLSKLQIMKPPIHSPFGKSSFCLLDIETTGLSTEWNEITEIAVIRVNESFEITGEMSKLNRIDITTFCV